MITHINYEVFSPAMKARLDPTYRRVIQEEQNSEIDKLYRSVYQSDHETALPFTTKTKAYGTYVRRRQ
jgi:hypothetical protein